MRHRPDRRVLAAALVLVLAASATAGGCAQNRETWLRSMDEAARERAETVDTEAKIVVSLHGDAAHPVPAVPPVEVEEVGRATNSVLWAGTKVRLAQKTAIPEGLEVVVWGLGANVVRLDPGLRAQLLEQLESPATRKDPLPVVMVFVKEPVDTSRLTARGVAVRSVAGRVVTADADVDALLALLDLPDLVKVARPAERQFLEPATGSAGR